MTEKFQNTIGARVTLSPKDWKEAEIIYESMVDMITTIAFIEAKTAVDRSRAEDIQSLLTIAGAALHIVAENEVLQKGVQFGVKKKGGKRSD